MVLNVFLVYFWWLVVVPCMHYPPVNYKSELLIDLYFHAKKVFFFHLTCSHLVDLMRSVGGGSC